MKKFIFIISAIVFVILLTGCKAARETAPEKQLTKEEYNSMINERKYTFKPHQIIPMAGPSRYLSYDYSLKISNDTLDVYLPYFGRAYTAPMDANEGGIRFKSTDFEYTMTEKKAGSYDITIKPNDIESNMNRGIVFYLSLRDNGYGSLNINFVNRQSVSYYGVFE